MNARNALQIIRHRVNCRLVQPVTDPIVCGDDRRRFSDAVLLELQASFTRHSRAYARRRAQMSMTTPRFKCLQFEHFFDALIREIEKNQQ